MESSKDNFDLLGSFLCEDINNRDHLYRFKKHLANPDFHSVGYEWTEIFKEGSLITLCDALFEFGTEQDSFELSFDSFVSAINEWEKILKIMPSEVTITQVDDKITFDYKI